MEKTQQLLSLSHHDPRRYVTSTHIPLVTVTLPYLRTREVGICLCSKEGRTEIFVGTASHFCHCGPTHYVLLRVSSLDVGKCTDIRLSCSDKTVQLGAAGKRLFSGWSVCFSHQVMDIRTLSHPERGCSWERIGLRPKTQRNIFLPLGLD